MTNMGKHIGVISKDLQDFLEWKELMKLKADKLDTRKKFTVNETTYHCLYKPTHIIGLALNSVVETKSAKRGGAYASTMTLAKAHLVEDPQLKINFNK